MESAAFLYIAIILSAVSWLMFLTYVPSNKHIPGVKLWVYGLFTFGLALFLLSQEDLRSNLWAEFVPNVLLLSALTLITIGIRSFYGIFRHQVLIATYMLVLTPSIAYYFTYFAHDDTMLRVSSTLLALSCFLIIIFSLTGVKNRAGIVKKVLLTFCIVSSAMLFVRIYLKINYNAEIRLEQHGAVEQVIHALFLCFGVVFSLIFSLLCQERNAKYLTALTIKSDNERLLKSLYMTTLKQELDEPLTKITKISDILRKLGAPEIEKSALFIQKQSQLIQQIAHETLKQQNDESISSDATTKVTYTKIELWLNDIFASLYPLADDKQLTLSVTFNDPVAPSYLIDEYKLRLVLVGLLAKFIDFKDSGTIDLTIFITPAPNAREAANIRFSFRTTDTKTISQPVDKQLFSNDFTGRICEKTLELLDSTLDFIDSQHGHSIFEFNLKVSEGNNNDVRYQVPRYATPSFSNLETVLVSHCQRTTETVTLALREQKHHVVHIDNIESLIFQLNAQKYDVVILDINATKFNSLEIPRIIKNKCHSNKRIPMVALTNNLCSAAKLDLEVEGLITLVAKPIKHSSLIRAIGSVIEQSLIEPNSKPGVSENSEPSPVLTLSSSSLNDELRRQLNDTPPDDVITQAKTSSTTEQSSQRAHKKQLLSEQHNNVTLKQQPPKQVSLKEAPLEPTPSPQDIAPIASPKPPEPQLFNPLALTLLIKNRDSREIKELIQQGNKGVNKQLAQVKAQLNQHSKKQLKATLYQFAISSDKLGYVYLAEKLLTLDLDDVQGNGKQQYLLIESLLVQSQTSLAEHLKNVE